MVANKAMARLLKENNIKPESLAPDASYPIWKKLDQKERPYWGVSNFWNMDQGCIPGEQDLSRLEWDGNEIFLDAEGASEIPGILKKAVGILKYWKQLLEQTEPETPFFLFAYFDDGGMLGNPEDHPNGWASITLRFWADRSGEPTLDFSLFDAWEQPALWDRCNDSADPNRAQPCLNMLILSDPECSYDDYSEDFPIGLFETEQQAKETAQFYLQNVKGFSEYPCTWRIERKPVHGERNGASVWMITGWDRNEEQDEVNIVESPCFTEEAQARQELQAMKQRYPRQEWFLAKWTVGQKLWEEGFTRYTWGGSEKNESHGMDDCPG